VFVEIHNQKTRIHVTRDPIRGILLVSYDAFWAKFSDIEILNPYLTNYTKWIEENT